MLHDDVVTISLEGALKISKMGVYVLKNKINGKMYVGSSNDLKLRRRVHFHHLRNNIHENRWLQKSFIKHGEINFEFLVLETVQVEENLIEREQYYLDLYKTYSSHKGYNICPKAGGTEGTTYTAEAKGKIAASKRGKPATGRNKRGPYHCRAKTYTLQDPDGKVIQITNMEDFAREHDLDSTHLLDVAHGRSKSHGGYALPGYVKREYSFELRAPDGTVKTITGSLKKWCEENGLRYKSIQNIVYGLNKAYLGWTLPETVIPEKKKWIVRSPDGEIFEPENLKQFCREHGLADSAMVGVCNGKPKFWSHKGWTCPLFEKESTDIKYCFLNPAGEVQEIAEITNFCDKNGLNHGEMYKVFKGLVPSHHGWKPVSGSIVRDDLGYSWGKSLPPTAEELEKIKVFGKYENFSDTGIKISDRVTLEIAVLKEATRIVVYHHYLHRCRTMAQLAYWIKLDDTKVGVLLYSYPRLSSEVSGVQPMNILELARVWLHDSVQGVEVADSSGQKHAACIVSSAISKANKRVRNDWYQKYNRMPDIDAVISYADTTRYDGTIYKAANFIDLGERKGSSTTVGVRSDGSKRVSRPDYANRKRLYMYKFIQRLSPQQREIKWT